MAQDLSRLAENSLWPTSQDGGNMTSERPDAMSAPGTKPSNAAMAERLQPPPEIAFSNSKPIEPGHTGSKPAPSPGVPSAQGATWVKTSTA